MLMVFAIFPLSLYKEVSALRYICMAGVAITFYISIIIAVEPFVGSINGFDFSDNIKNTKWFDAIGIVKTFPFAMFSFFCQPNS
jgi:amino acid permease